jgi:hypothetical protein
MPSTTTNKRNRLRLSPSSPFAAGLSIVAISSAAAKAMTVLVMTRRYRLTVAHRSMRSGALRTSMLICSTRGCLQGILLRQEYGGLW